MKKRIIFYLICLLFLVTNVASAAWSIVVSKPVFKGSFSWFKATCTGDGTALTATNILSTTYGMSTAHIKTLRDGHSLKLLWVNPGTGGTQPSGTINVTLTNEFASDTAELWSETGISNTTNTWYPLWEDIGDYPPILGKINLAINDIGSGKVVVLYFITGKE